MKIDLAAAEKAFAVANTPLFLLHKLRADPATQALGRSSVPSAVILRALKRHLQRKPRSLRDAVKPYVYLVALSFRPDSSILERAAQMPTLYFDWYHYLASALVQGFKPTSVRSLYVPGGIMAPDLSTKTETPTTRILLP